MSAGTVLCTVENGIAHVRLNRPHRLNAMIPELMSELHDVLQRAGEDKDVKVVILSGQGKAFCAGDDLKESAAGRRELSEVCQFVYKIQRVSMDIKRMPKPVIAAVHGYALGGGCELALGCDLIVAALDAQFGFPETSVGLFVTGGVTQFLPNTVGLARAKELIMVGEYFDGSEAMRLGLVNRVVSSDAVLPTAEGLAKQIMGKAPMSIALAKIALEAGSHSDLATAMALESQATINCFQSEDAREAAQAFVEKRSARFRGR